MPGVFPGSRKMIVLRRRRTTYAKTEQNQAFDEEIGKRPEQLPKEYTYESLFYH
jgi:hypothetical protein